MPSFDIVSDVDQVEVRNAVDQANKEIGNRFDFTIKNEIRLLEWMVVRMCHAAGLVLDHEHR